MVKLLLMLQFLTRIPVPSRSWIASDEEFREGIIFFPVVGFIVGLFIVSSFYIGNLIGGRFLAVVTAVLVEAFITGGLHLDGLADTFDGMYSNRPKDKVLEIMKDSRIGTNGTLAIIFTVLLKAALLYHITIPEVYPALLLMPVFSRLTMVFACRFSRYARENGLGNYFIGRINNKHVGVAVLWSVLFALIFPWTLIYLFIAYLFSRLYIKHITGIIEGMTGDTLGALCELSELFYLMYISIILMIGR